MGFFFFGFVLPLGVLLMSQKDKMHSMFTIMEILSNIFVFPILFHRISYKLFCDTVAKVLVFHMLGTLYTLCISYFCGCKLWKRLISSLLGNYVNSVPYGKLFHKALMSKLTITSLHHYLLQPILSSYVSICVLKLIYHETGLGQ